jgi:hypothetical protein
VWSRLQFPRDYLQHWTRRGPGGSLRVEAQTVPSTPPVPLAL